MDILQFLPHIAGRILNTPLMITPQRLDVIIQAIAPRIGLTLTAGDSLPEFDEDPSRFGLRFRAQPGIEEYEKHPVGLIFEKGLLVDMSRPKRYRDERSDDGIGLIPIYDTLVYRQYGPMQPVSGHMTSYEEIKKWFVEANEDPSIHTILFDVDSPGGEVSGVFDLVDYILASKQKPIYAVVNEATYSAAYAISSAADKIYVPRTGSLGSVGVIAVHIDKSKANEAQGLKYTPIFSGSHKNDFSPNQPLSEDAYKIAKEQVDEIYDLFVRTVSKNRKMTLSAVRNTEAGIFQGQRGVDIGFADGVKSFGEVIEMIHQNQNRKGAKKMPSKAEEQTVETSASPVTEQPPKISQPELDKIKAEAAAGARKEAIEAEKVRVCGIRNACMSVKHLIAPDLVDQLINDGVSIEEANKKIIASLAPKSEETQVRSTVGALSTGQKNSLVENARQRQQAAGQKGPLV